LEDSGSKVIKVKHSSSLQVVYLFPRVIFERKFRGLTPNILIAPAYRHIISIIQSYIPFLSFNETYLAIAVASVYHMKIV